MTFSKHLICAKHSLSTVHTETQENVNIFFKKYFSYHTKYIYIWYALQLVCYSKVVEAEVFRSARDNLPATPEMHKEQWASARLSGALVKLVSQFTGDLLREPLL